jgi:hypothetical protein
MLFGHLAVSVLQHRYLKADLVPVVIAGIFPDVVDKSMCYVLHVVPSGRTWGHTLLSMGLSTITVSLIWGRRFGYSWALGYIGHLLGDFGSALPWFYPFRPYEFPPSSLSLWTIIRRFLANPPALLFELALSVWAISALIFKPSRPWPKARAKIWPKAWQRIRTRTPLDRI